MKILHVLDHSLPKLDGYAVRSANIVRFQRDLNIEPVVVTSSSQPENGPVDVEVIDEIPHYRTPATSAIRIPFLSQQAAIRQMARRIDQVAEIERPDVLHAHSPCLWGEAAARVARRRRLPLVYEIRGFWEDAAVDQGKTTNRSLRYKLSRWLESRVVRKATCVVTIAEGLRTDVLGRGIADAKVFVVPNGVDVDRFQPRPPDEQLKSHLDLHGEVCIGYVGTLYPWEGVEDLVRAMLLIARHKPDVVCLIVGSGVEEQAIRALILDLGLSQRVRFLGTVPHRDVTRYYSLMDFVVYPRKRTRNTELVTPLKPLEAMVMMRPVVGSDVGGIRELLGPEAGLQFRAGDPNDLADKCLQLINYPERRKWLAQTARAYVVGSRNWRVIAKQYPPIYEVARRGS